MSCVTAREVHTEVICAATLFRVFASGADFLVGGHATTVGRHADIAPLARDVFALVRTLSNCGNAKVGGCGAGSVVACPGKSRELSCAVCICCAGHAVERDVNGTAGKVGIGTGLADGAVLWEAERLARATATKAIEAKVSAATGIGLVARDTSWIHAAVLAATRWVTG